MRKHLFLIVVSFFGLTQIQSQTYVPVATVGYSLDGVAENTTAISTTGGQIDNSDFVLYSQYYGTLYGGGAVGLPNNGTIVNGLRTYQLQNYLAYNVMRINANLRDSLTFVNPQAFPSISLLSFATQGAATISVTVRFTDNTTQIFSSLPLDDWFTANPSIINGVDRVQRSTGTPALVGGAGNPRLFATDLAIACANRGKPIKRVIIQNNSVAIACVMAVAGAVPAYSVNAPAFVCNGSTATLSASGFVTYTWQPSGSFAGANTSTAAIAPTSPTTYTLEGTDSGGCPGYTVVTININNALPVLSLAGSSSSVCLGSAATITVSGASTYTLSSPAANGGTFAPVNTATYTVSGANACGTTTAATTITVQPLPTVNPSASSSTLCSGSVLTLSATGNATNYVWSGGSAPSGNGVGFTPPPSTTTYSVVGTNSLGCSALATIPVTVYATPILPPTSSPSIGCVGSSFTLTASGALNYTWTSASQTVFTPTFVVTPGSAGVTTYTVTKSNLSCSDTKTISVTTNSLPTVFALALPSTVCALQPSSLSIAGGQSYTWTAPGTPNFTFTGATPIVYPQSSSLYTVAASDGTCTSSTTLSVTVNPNPTISISASSASICTGQSATLTALGGNSYTWTTPSGTLNTSSITVSPGAAASYTLTGDNSNGCTATTNQVILVYQSPAVSITVSKPLVCSGGASTLTASGAISYTWDANAASATTSVAVVNPTSTVSGPVIYTVTGINSLGCPGTQTALVNVYVPALTVTGTTSLCAGGQVSLTATGVNASGFSWNTGSGSQAGAVLTTTVSTAGVFTVSASSASQAINCSAAQTVAIGVYPNPNVTAVAQRTTICKNEQVDLEASGAASYTWSNAMNGATITVSPQSNSVYTVTGIDANQCLSTGTVQVKVSACNGINEFVNAGVTLSIYPNPNAGSFRIEAGEELYLLLVNELGQTVRTIRLSKANAYSASITDLASGVYLLSGKNESGSINKRIIVTK